MTQFGTIEVYISGAICGHMWMPQSMAGVLLKEDARGHWGFFDKGDSWRDALLSLLGRKGGDFQDAAFTEDTEIVVIRRAVEGPGLYRVHSRRVPIAKLRGCSDLVKADTYTFDFSGEE